ncbi:hypothetical protein ACFL0A_01855 [Patescibacteria group bacterium]
MSFTSWINSSIKNLNWTDVSLVKLSVAGFILMIAKLWEPLLSLSWYWYAVIGLLAALKPLQKMLKK